MLLEDSYKHKGLRRNLLHQLQTKGIRDKNVLEAMMKVPRHLFFDKAFLEHAYQDKAFPIGEGQTISQPYTVAFQTSLLEIKKGDVVLEIGTGSGYQTCILLELGAKVYTIEFNRILFENTRKFLPRLNYQANFVHGDGSMGYPSAAPYDKILVTAGAPSVPLALIEQLKDNGMLVIPVGDNKLQKMIRVTRYPDKRLKKEEFDNFSFVPLLGKYGW